MVRDTGLDLTVCSIIIYTMLAMVAMSVVLNGFLNLIGVQRNAGIMEKALKDLLKAAKKTMYILTFEEEEVWRKSEKHTESPYHFLYKAIIKAEKELAKVPSQFYP